MATCENDTSLRAADLWRHVRQRDFSVLLYFVQSVPRGFNLPKVNIAPRRMSEIPRSKNDSWGSSVFRQTPICSHISPPMDPTRTGRIMARHITPVKTNPEWAEAAAWRCVACFFFSFLYCCSLSFPSFDSLFLLVSLGGTKKSVLSLIIFSVCGLSSSFPLWPRSFLSSFFTLDGRRNERGGGGGIDVLERELRPAIRSSLEISPVSFPRSGRYLWSLSIRTHFLCGRRSLCISFSCWILISFPFCSGF